MTIKQDSMTKNVPSMTMDASSLTMDTASTTKDKGSHNQRGQHGHQARRTLDTPNVALNPGNLLRQVLAFSAFVVKNALPQKLRMFLVFAHHR